MSCRGIVIDDEGRKFRPAPDRRLDIAESGGTRRMGGRLADGKDLGAEMRRKRKPEFGEPAHRFRRCNGDRRMRHFHSGYGGGTIMNWREERQPRDLVAK